jgi:hypothetical protein
MTLKPISHTHTHIYIYICIYIYIVLEVKTELYEFTVILIAYRETLHYFFIVFNKYCAILIIT